MAPLTHWIICGGLTASLATTVFPGSARTASAPAAVVALVNSIDRAANDKQITTLANSFAPGYTLDGLGGKEWQQAVSSLWQRYPDLRYRTTIKGWRPESSQVETFTQMEGTGTENGKTIKLVAEMQSRQKIVNGKVAQQEIMSEKVVATTGSKAPTVDLRIPEKIRVNADYSIDAIVQEPLGEEVMMGAITERAVGAAAYTRAEGFNLELLSTGGLFKDAKAPGKPGDYWLSVVFIRPDGMTTVTRRFHVLRRG